MVKNENCILCKAFNKPDGSMKIYYHDNVCCFSICPKCNNAIAIYKNHFNKPLKEKERVEMVNAIKKFGNVLPIENDINTEHYIIHFKPFERLEIAEDIKLTEYYDDLDDYELDELEVLENEVIDENVEDVNVGEKELDDVKSEENKEA